jgi:hypothetical protein
MTTTIGSLIADLQRLALAHGRDLPVKVEGDRATNDLVLMVCGYQYRDGSYSRGDADELADPNPPVPVPLTLVIFGVDD